MLTMTLVVLLSALLLDYYFGAPKKYHPIVGFKTLAVYLEQRLNDYTQEKQVELNPEEQHKKQQQNRINGLIAVIISLIPAWWLTKLIIFDGFLGNIVEVLILYLALGLSQLRKHSGNVLNALLQQHKDQARHNLSLMVNHETRHLDEVAQR